MNQEIAYKPSILFIGQVPPPVHGTTLMNRQIVDSDFIKERFEIIHINPQFSRKISDIERFYWYKIGILFKTWFRQFWILCTRRVDLFYYSLSVNKMAVARDLLFIATALLFNKKIVLKFDGLGLMKVYEQVSGCYKWFMTGLLSKVTGGIIMSSRLAYDVEHFIATERLHIVPNGIGDPRPDHILPLDIKLAPESVKILFLSNMMRAKGTLVLLEAIVKIIIDDNKDAYFIFAGAWYEDDVKERFQAIVKEYALEDRIIYMGPVWGEQKFGLFKAVDIFVLPTLRESFGIVNVEAMSMGLPVITTNIGGVPDVVVDSQTGFIVEPDDTAGLRHRLLTLIDDKDKRLEMGSLGRERYCREYTLANWERRMADVFLTIAKS